MREEILVDTISKQITTAETARILRLAPLGLIFISLWMRFPRIERFQIFSPRVFSLTLRRPHPKSPAGNSVKEFLQFHRP